MSVEYVQGLQALAFNGAVERAKNRASQDEIKDLRSKLKREKAKIRNFRKNYRRTRSRSRESRRGSSVRSDKRRSSKRQRRLIVCLMNKKAPLAQDLGKKRDFEEIR